MNTKLPQHQKAAALLLTTITLAAVTLVIVSGSAVFIASSRQHLAKSSANEAESYALSALREGMYRLSKNVGLTSNREYGLTNNEAAQVTSTIVRGMKAGTNCSQILPEQVGGTFAEPDADCPSQELAIRNLVTVRPDQNGSADYTVWYSDIGGSKVLEIPLVPQSNISTIPEITFTLSPFAQGVQYQLCTSVSGSADCTAKKDRNPNEQIKTGFYTKRVIFYVTNYVEGQLSADSALITAHSNSIFTMGKLYTTIDATGILPDGTEKRLLAIMRNNGTVVRVRTDAFNEDGFCEPNPDACH